MTSVTTRARPLGGSSNKSKKFPSPTDFAATPSARLKFVTLNMLGRTVIVHLKNGKKWQGILHAVNDDDAGFELLWAKELVPLDAPVQRPVPSKRFSADEFVMWQAHEVDLYDLADSGGDAVRNRGEVVADTEIEVAGGRAEFGAERELQAATAWLDGGGGALGDMSMANQKGGQRWDQFSANEKLGAGSTYSDELYTTKLTGKKFSDE